MSCKIPYLLSYYTDKINIYDNEISKPLPPTENGPPPVCQIYVPLMSNGTPYPAPIYEAGTLNIYTSNAFKPLPPTDAPIPPSFPIYQPTLNGCAYNIPGYYAEGCFHVPPANYPPTPCPPGPPAPPVHCPGCSCPGCSGPTIPPYSGSCSGPVCGYPVK